MIAREVHVGERDSEDARIRPPEEAGPATDTEQNVTGARWGGPEGAAGADGPAFNVDSDRSMEGKRESFDIAADQRPGGNADDKEGRER
jgi:hypothetical protein